MSNTPQTIDENLLPPSDVPSTATQLIHNRSTLGAVPGANSQLPIASPVSHELTSTSTIPPYTAGLNYPQPLQPLELQGPSAYTFSYGTPPPVIPSHPAPPHSAQATPSSFNSDALDHLSKSIQNQFEEIKKSNNALQRRIDNLNRDAADQILEEMKPPPNFPLEKIEDFRAFENHGEQYHQTLRNFYRFIRDKKAMRKCIHNFFSGSMSPIFSTQFTFNGTNETIGLYDTQLLKQMTIVAKVTFADITADEFQHHVSEVLRSIKQIGKKISKEKDGPPKKHRKMQAF